METVGYPHEQERYKKRSKAIAIAAGVIMLLLMIYPFLTYPVPPLGQEGILVNLGVIDYGQGDENGAAAAAPVEEEAREETSAEETVEDPLPQPQPEPEPVPEILPPPPAPVVEPADKPVPDNSQQQELLRQQETAAIALRQRREAERQAEVTRNQEQAAAREQQRRVAEAKQAEEARKQAEARAQAEAKAAADKKAAAEAKASALRAATGSLFNGNQGDGGGKGNADRAGNQGDPNGDPNAARTQGLSSGTGNVGGGLGSRGVLSSPRIADNSQERGKIVIAVCVNSDGRVTTAEYTQRGSTSTSARLIELARRNAMNYRFNKSSSDTQCGNITYDFVVQ